MIKHWFNTLLAICLHIWSKPVACIYFFTSTILKQLNHMYSKKINPAYWISHGIFTPKNKWATPPDLPAAIFSMDIAICNHSLTGRLMCWWGGNEDCSHARKVFIHLLCNTTYFLLCLHFMSDYFICCPKYMSQSESWLPQFCETSMSRDVGRKSLYFRLYVWVW